MRGSVREETVKPKRVDPAEYTESYYLTDCEGFDLFAESGGSQLSPRLARALELAAIQPGHRVLDVACGRGEMVVQAALRGAQAFGIDYASAAMKLAQRIIRDQTANCDGSAVTVRMDATRIGFPPATFDTVFMLDFVEHVYHHELEQAFDEALRVLKPSGQLIIHTSPNRLFESVVYSHYVRHVHRVVLALARRLRIQDRLLNPLMLPTSPELPHSDYDRQLHVNEHTSDGLHKLLMERGFRSLKVSFWEPPSRPFYNSWRESRELQVLNLIRYLRPFSRYWPLSRFFSNHIWIVARRPG